MKLKLITKRIPIEKFELILSEKFPKEKINITI